MFSQVLAAMNFIGLNKISDVSYIVKAGVILWPMVVHVADVANPHPGNVERYVRYVTEGTKKFEFGYGCFAPEACENQ